MKKLCCIFLMVLITPCARAVVEYTLPAAATSKVFDRTNGMLYLGLEEITATGYEKFAISRFGRFSGSSTINASGIATDSLLTTTIEYLALGEGTCTTQSKLAAVTENNSVAFSQTKVIALSTDGTTVTETANDLNDAGGNTTEGIVNLAASSSYVFAAVRANGGNFGVADSGIAPIALADDTLAQTAGTTAQLDLNSTAIKVGASVISFGGTPNENITLYWDTTFERLYAGVMIAGNAGLQCVAIGRFDSGTLTMNKIVPESAFTNNLENIIVTKSNTTGYIGHVRIMHASTGSSYLIVNGALDVVNKQARNAIFALPLVDNSSNAAQHGTLAKKDSALTNGKFTVQATAVGDLLSLTGGATADRATARVGGGPLPLPNTAWPTDMIIVGDTVYASIAEEADTNVDPGIFSSQALFGEDGKIINWTPWSKRIYPFDGFPSSITTTAELGKVQFFAVDAVNGKVWAVDGSTKLNLGSVAWTQGTQTDTTTLVAQLNASLSSGCFSALDLDWSTRGLGVSSASRYALFGGINTVVFARVSTSKAGASPYDKAAATDVPYGQTIITDFSAATDYLETTLQDDPGAVLSLAYSQRLVASANQNYFFAGTHNGLYAFSTNDAGFTASAPGALNAAPFSTGSWTKIEGVDGSVIALKTSGNGLDAAGNGGLYILTMESTSNATRPLVSKIYRMPYNTTATLMEAGIVTIAESGVTATNSDLSPVDAILGMEIISTGDNGSLLATATVEQLVIATNVGLYVSQATTANGVISATNQADAQWGWITAGGTGAHDNIFAPDNALVRTKIWPLEISDEQECKTFDRSTLKQLLGTYNGIGFLPSNFNAISDDAAFKTINPTTYFYSDGGRRFLIIKRLIDASAGNKLSLLPFDTDTWCVSSPDSIVPDSMLSNICAFYWTKQIGASGFLMAGHNKGVVSLE